MAFLNKSSARWWYIVVTVAIIQFMTGSATKWSPAITTFVPSFRSRRDPQAHISFSKVDAPHPYRTFYADGQCSLAASTSSSTEENVVKFIAGGSSKAINETSTHEEKSYQEIDKVLLVNQTENTPWIDPTDPEWVIGAPPCTSDSICKHGINYKQKPNKTCEILQKGK